eukprot:CAMPEP_0202873432 /NCGR_PEP_ID=MMETSP1391-20130828/23260_1 /ASSEMBLY_ACC=CAM_ASM_000867 /TAXON_ID=1034604 /ORGANISM="Chlamydomonas leiostraca, Strain SAG 11-49" /LENGTH=60 /DNA_ID=CAMNT_0049554651 /DNA_START=10 /DNA_END=188 /DNA_ORIENTATION=-
MRSACTPTDTHTALGGCCTAVPGPLRLRGTAMSAAAAMWAGGASGATGEREEAEEEGDLG